jgi:PAS domain S-box-containing protein
VNSSPIDTFSALLSSRQQALVEAIAHDIADRTALFASAGSLAGAAAWAEGLLATCTDVHAQADRASRLASHFLDLAGRDARPGEVLRAVSICRRHIVRHSLDSPAEGVAEGLAALMDALDAAAEAVAELYEARLRDAEARLSTIQRREAEIQTIFDHAPLAVFVKDLEGRFTFTNRSFDELFNFPKGYTLGKVDADFLPPEVARANRENDAAALQAGRPIEFEEAIPAKDGVHIYWAAKFPLRDPDGTAYAVCGVASDITRLRRAEEERAALQARVIEAQHEALRELSTPLLPIADGVVVLPLVGALDAARAAQVLEVLLDGIVGQRARTAILDITGVRDVDANVASGLVQAAQAARLLGAEVLLTGIRPAAARTLVELGVDLGGLVTLSSLQQGVAHAMSRAGRRR